MIVRLKPCIAFRRVGDRPSPPRHVRGPRALGSGAAVFPPASAAGGTEPALRVGVLAQVQEAAQPDARLAGLTDRAVGRRDRAPRG